MFVYEKSIQIPFSSTKNLLNYFKNEIEKQIGDEVPIRLVVTNIDTQFFYCEVALIKDIKENLSSKFPSVFSFKKRKLALHKEFNAVLMVPTGIGAEIGGHAGDAGPTAKLLASVCDKLITHPNVVNASDINEMPSNGLYVEGSTLCRLLMGDVGLNPVRSNRVLFVMDNNDDRYFISNSINSLNAARATYGLNCPLIVELNPPLSMTLAHTESGRASGVVDKMDSLLNALEAHKDQYDAIAFSTIIHYEESISKEYFESGGKILNPWGGIEALLTHTISLLYNLPSAHSPMKESQEHDLLCQTIKDPLDPRIAAEFVSMTYLQCILKGMHNSPQIVTDSESMQSNEVITARDISCLVIPEHCLGLPVLAALEQGIIVIAVKENKNVMKNNLNLLPWQQGQYYEVENYLEAAGLISALKAGITPESIHRPLNMAPIENYTLDTNNPEAYTVKKAAAK